MNVAYLARGIVRNCGAISCLTRNSVTLGHRRVVTCTRGWGTWVPEPVGQVGQGPLASPQKPHNAATRRPIPTGIPRTKSNTTGARARGLACPRRGKTTRRGRGLARVSGDTRESIRDSARVVVEVECGITVYPPGEAGEPWRAVFTENGRRRYRQAMTEAELAAKLEKVTERLRAGAPDMERPGPHGPLQPPRPPAPPQP